MLRPLLGIVLIAFASAGCSATRPRPSLELSKPVPRLEPKGQVGTASYYHGSLNGRRTASGDTYDARAFTAAHRTLEFGTRVVVTNLANARSVVLTITDRGPFVRGRIIDVSRRAARALGFIQHGTARVRVTPLT